VRMNQGIATGVSEARLQQRRGKKTPTLMTPGREAVEHGFRADLTIRRSGLGGRETSSPPILLHTA